LAAAADCWEAQLVVTSDPARAERVRAEAAALLGVPVRVVSAGGMHRVRAGGCLDAEAALRLVERARAEGWPEAFRTEAAR
jgi:cell division protein FtsN